MVNTPTGRRLDIHNHYTTPTAHQWVLRDGGGCDHLTTMRFTPQWVQCGGGAAWRVQGMEVRMRGYAISGTGSFLLVRAAQVVASQPPNWVYRFGKDGRLLMGWPTAQELWCAAANGVLEASWNNGHSWHWWPYKWEVA